MKASTCFQFNKAHHPALLSACESMYFRRKTPRGARGILQQVVSIFFEICKFEYCAEKYSIHIRKEIDIEQKVNATEKGWKDEYFNMGHKRFGREST